MVSTKTRTSGCKRCCCSKCGVQLDNAAKGCCLCVCDELCVTVDGNASDPNPCDNCGCLDAGDCSCFTGSTTLSWDFDNCEYSGTVVCGALSIDLTVKIKKCDDGSCYACVSSTCLSMSGTCGTSDCFALGTCGSYGDGCLQDGGISFNFTAVPSSCGDTNCTNAVTITISCTNFINPQPDPPICRNCDCVCECICITYEEDGCAGVKKACYDSANSRWQTTFSPDSPQPDLCTWSDQTVTIELGVDNDGCCFWKLTTTRGTVTTPEQATDCPRPTTTWEFDDLTATVTIACSTCDECAPDTPCCPNDLPTTLYARVCSACPEVCTQLDLAGKTSTEVSWMSGTVTLQCQDQTSAEPPFPCTDFDVVIEFACIVEGGSTTWEIRVYCNGVLTESQGTTVSCDTVCGSAGFTDTIACDFYGVCADSFTICVSEVPC